MAASDMIEIKMTINGAEVSGSVEGRMLLVQFIRDYIGLTGTHIGCDTSQCGCCTLHMNGVAVKSCTILAAHADGADIATIEGSPMAIRCIPCKKPFATITRCNVATARRVW